VNKVSENDTELPSYSTRVRRGIVAAKRIVEVKLKVLSHPRWQVKEQGGMAGVVCELQVKLVHCVSRTHTVMAYSGV